MNPPEAVTLVVRRNFPYSAERVFDSWLNPVLAREFLFTTPASKVVHCEIDAHVGGRYTLVDRRPDGLEITHVGSYLEIDRPHRLVFTLQVPQFSPEEDKVVLTLTPLASGCELVLTTMIAKSALDQFPLAEMEKGWTMILSGLGDALASPQS